MAKKPTAKADPQKTATLESCPAPICHWKIVSIILLFSLANVLILLSAQLKQTQALGRPSLSPTPSPKPKIKVGFDVPYQNNQARYSYQRHLQLTAPSVISLQRENSWQYLDCVHYDPDQYEVDIEFLQEHLSNPTLIGYLSTIEEHQFTTRLHNDAGEVIDEYQSQKEINYSSICMDDSHYYILFLTKGNKQSMDTSLRLLPQAYAAGGWLGDSNLAIVDKTENVEIFENIMENAQLINVTPLEKYATPTSRSFAYFSCGSFVGTLGDNLIISCGGEGGGGIYNFNLQDQDFTELSFTFQNYEINQTEYYDQSGDIYYTAK